MDFTPKRKKKSTVGELKALFKRFKAEQLLAEVKLHNLTKNTYKIVRELSSELNAHQIKGTGSNKIRAILLPDRNIGYAEMMSLAEEYMVENILLKDGELYEHK